MSYTLFLDDERVPEQVTWVCIPKIDNIMIVRNYQEFVEHIEQFGVPNFVCFDHDLADFHYQVMMKENSYTYDDGDLVKTFDYGSEKTGYDCAKWLVEYCDDNSWKFPDYVVHSMNNVGKERIENFIEAAKEHLNI